MSENIMNEDTMNALANLAGNPYSGQPFTFGGEQFTRRFMTIDAQAEFAALVTGVMKDGKNRTIEDNLIAAMPMLKKCLEIILTNQKPHCNMAWIESQVGPDVKVSNMVGIVMGQMILNDMGDLLGKVLAVAAIAASVLPKK